MSEVEQQQDGTTSDDVVVFDEVDLEAHSASGDRAPRARRYLIRVDDDRVRRVSSNLRTGSSASSSHPLKN